MKVANTVLQNSIKQRRPLVVRLIRVILDELDHRNLHEVERLVTVAHGDFGVAQRATLDVLEESVQNLRLLQRLSSRITLAARYRICGT